MKKPKRKNQITKSEAVAFRNRWEVVNAFEKEELCNTSVDEKLRQLVMLMTLAEELDWTLTSERETSAVRNRWDKLRKACHAQKRTSLASS